MSFADENTLFSGIPDRRPPLKEFVFSMGVQAVLLVAVAWIAILHPEVITQPLRKIQVTQLVSTPPPVNHTPAPVKVFKTEPVPVAEPVVAPRVEALKLPPQIRRTAPKEEVQAAPKVEVAVNKPLQIAPTTAVIPKQLVKTEVFSTGSSATPTMAAAPKNVQTGGFGDPNGVPAHDSDNNKPATIAAKGSFDLPSGPGFGNGTGGATGKPGVVASAGFGNGTATGDGSGRVNSSSGNGNGNVRQAGFGDTEPVAIAAKTKPAEPAVPHSVPAQVLSKPNPLYTEEARKMKIEGEVLLEVVFESGGKVRVNKVIRGLGHGLDEAAIHAAEEIHFKPAMRDGQPSDSTAVLHIVFQLA
jgi:TonB family protein